MIARGTRDGRIRLVDFAGVGITLIYVTTLLGTLLDESRYEGYEICLGVYSYLCNYKTKISFV